MEINVPMEKIFPLPRGANSTLFNPTYFTYSKMASFDTGNVTINYWPGRGLAVRV
jgi:hypothetical protein